MLEQKIIPMEPQSKKVLIENPDYSYQIKWDGVRLLAFVSGKRVRLQGRSLKDKSVLYPELAVLPELVRGKSAILDGEIIALRENRPDFYTIMQRERAGPAVVTRMAGLVPAYYMVFDLLYFDGTWLLEQPWEARQEMIFKHILTGEYLHLTPSYQEGEVLLKTVQEKGMEGVVAKKKDSPYIPGPRRSSYWLKIKIQQTLEAYVGGIAMRDQRPVSLLLGLEEEEPEAIRGPGIKLRYIGNVSSGLREKDLAAWYDWAQENRSSEPPFKNLVLSPGRGYLFVQPHKKVRVTFSEWTPTLKLRAPRLIT